MEILKKSCLILILSVCTVLGFASVGFASTSGWTYNSSNDWFVGAGGNSEIDYSARIFPGKNFSSGSTVTHRGWINNKESSSQNLRMIVGHHGGSLSFDSVRSISGYTSYTSQEHRLLSDGTWRVTINYSSVPSGGWRANDVRFISRTSGTYNWNAFTHGSTKYQSGAGKQYQQWQFLPGSNVHLFNPVTIGN